VGWRIDYFFVSDNLEERIKSAFIMTEVLGSDHCPVGIEMIDDVPNERALRRRLYIGLLT
jgi:hypothetical protein